MAAAARRSPGRCYKRDVLALLYDVHGNLPRARGGDRRRRGGRGRAAGSSAATTRCSAAGRPRPSSGCARSSRASWIRGNGERWTADPDAAPDNAVVPGRGRRGARGARRGRSWPTSPRCRSRCPHEGMLVCHGSPLSDVARSRPDDGERRRGAARRHRRAAGGLRPHPPAVRAHVGAAASSSSTRARSGCRSTATRARPTRCSATTGASSTGGSSYDHRASAERVRSIGEEWAEVVARRIEQAAMDV